MTKLILGCGYLGGRVAQRWLRNGEVVHVVTRSAARATTLAAEGYQPIVADITQPDTIPHLPQVETALFAVGFDRSAGYRIEDVYVEGLSNVLDKLDGDLQRFIYVSSSGVYGQKSGDWIDEDSPCDPTTPGGQACLEAERRLASSAFADRRIILRLAGIYGPDRVPRRDAIEQGEPIASPQEGNLNLIHVEDAVSVVLAAEEWRAPDCVLVADGEPVVRRDYFQAMASLLQAPPVTFIEPDSDSGRALRGMSNKRVSNRRLMSLYDQPLKFPNYQAGLAGILGSSESG